MIHSNILFVENVETTNDNDVQPISYNIIYTALTIPVRLQFVGLLLSAHF